MPKDPYAHLVTLSDFAAWEQELLEGFENLEPEQEDPA